jgi:CheY-like chemotaxis protein
MPKRILLADDSITIQKVVELTFSDGDYEVTAVNNGAKAVQKLSELRPDIILSDIIMPEKNGYEVCEYVKSHPEYRNIPVVLLTGTFEPFDPDRAEKAGCDAVVTKPFESQSLIHKVEELIAQSRSNAAAAPAAAPRAEETVSPWMDEAPSAPPPTSPFTSATQNVQALSMPEGFGHGSDIFGAATPAAASELPFETRSPETPFGAADEYSGETRAFQKMSFDDLPVPSAEPPPPPAISPWDEPAAASPFGSRPSSQFDNPSQDAATSASFEPPAFPAPSFDDAPRTEAESPFGSPAPEEQFSGETRAFPRMSFDDFQKLGATPEAAEDTPPAPPAVPEPSPWDQDAPAFGGETRAFEKMSFDDLSQAAPAAPALSEEPAPWAQPEQEAPAFEAESPAFSGETRAFQKMSFDDLQPAPPAANVEPPATPEPSPWDEAPEPVESLWSSEPSESPATGNEVGMPAAAAAFTDDAPAFDSQSFDAPPVPEDLPFAAEPEPAVESEQVWASESAAEAAAEPEEPVVPVTASPSALTPEAPPTPIATQGSLSDEQVDRIARRVIELMSDQVVRNIAWEVIPDVAEMLVKERIRQLESEA